MPTTAERCAVRVAPGCGTHGTGPSQGDVVFARQTGSIVNGKFQFMGKNAGKISHGSIRGAAGG